MEVQEEEPERGEQDELREPKGHEIEKNRKVRKNEALNSPIYVIVTYVVAC
jgi:hypothetical protein